VHLVSGHARHGEIEDEDDGGGFTARPQVLQRIGAAGGFRDPVALRHEHGAERVAVARLSSTIRNGRATPECLSKVDVDSRERPSQSSVRSAALVLPRWSVEQEHIDGGQM
jgi:hypothetical protein